MRCEDIRQIVEEMTELPGAAREHLAVCAACRAYARDGKLVRGGWRALASGEVPAAALGFAARLVRRLGEASGRERAEFFERVGRRVVFATLALTLTVLLAMAWPATGPLRGWASADVAMAQSEFTSSEDDTIFGPAVQDSPAVAPASLPGPGNERKQ